MLSVQVKVENAALLERLATSQAGLTADDMGAKLDAALAGKAVAEGEQARLESIVEQYVKADAHYLTMSLTLAIAQSEAGVHMRVIGVVWSFLSI